MNLYFFAVQVFSMRSLNCWRMLENIGGQNLPDTSNKAIQCRLFACNAFLRLFLQGYVIILPVAQMPRIINSTALYDGIQRHTLNDFT